MTHSQSWSSLRKHVIIAHTRVCPVEFRAHVCPSLPRPPLQKKQLQHMRFQALPQTSPGHHVATKCFCTCFFRLFGVCACVFVCLLIVCVCVCAWARVFGWKCCFGVFVFGFVGTHSAIWSWGTELAAWQVWKQGDLALHLWNPNLHKYFNDCVFAKSKKCSALLAECWARQHRICTRKSHGMRCCPIAGFATLNPLLGFRP